MLITKADGRDGDVKMLTTQSLQVGPPLEQMFSFFEDCARRPAEPEALLNNRDSQRGDQGRGWVNLLWLSALGSLSIAHSRRDCPPLFTFGQRLHPCYQE